ncbi:hypothetical protein ABIF67_010426, partial [Bradyrhizobium japonicum]
SSLYRARPFFNAEIPANRASEAPAPPESRRPT